MFLLDLYMVVCAVLRISKQGSDKYKRYDRCLAHAELISVVIVIRILLFDAALIVFDAV